MTDLRRVDSRSTASYFSFIYLTLLLSDMYCFTHYYHCLYTSYFFHGLVLAYNFPAPPTQPTTILLLAYILFTATHAPTVPSRAPTTSQRRTKGAAYVLSLSRRTSPSPSGSLVRQKRNVRRQLMRYNILSGALPRFCSPTSNTSEYNFTLFRDHG